MINVPGIGSGLDINSLISQLVSAEGDAKTAALSKKRNSVEAKISAFGQLNNALSKLQSAAARLRDPATFSSSKFTTGSPEIFTVSSSGQSAAGIYSIEVIETAQAHKLLSPAYASSSANVGTGQLTIYSGADSFTVTIDSEKQSLAGIRDAINGAEDNTGVSASIINVDDGGGGTVAKLVLTATATGVVNSLTVVVDDDDEADTDSAGLSALYYDTGDASSPEQMTQINAAVNASIRIDTELVTSPGNIITDAIQGTVINLLKKDPGNTHSLEITRDTKIVASAVASFISSYNSLNNAVNDMTVFDINTGRKGVLLGDQTILSLAGQIRRELNRSVPGVNGSVDSLVDLGVKTEKNGSLTLDTGKLETVLSSDINSVRKLFTADDGIAVGVDDLLNEYIRNGGVLDTRTEGLNKTIKGIDQDLVNLSARLSQLRERYLVQFTALDGLLSRLQQTSTFLDTQLSSIARISIRKT